MSDDVTIVQLDNAMYRVRKWGAFSWAVYIATHKLSTGLPLSLYVGTSLTRRGARRLAEKAIAERLSIEADREANRAWAERPTR